ncbi:hypothetical protein C8R44DRAFT_855929 [Mycena epipterygia]|nr:hypothetical protein C8R44DRAFT_855929 [Mycena epipterygia]
MTANDKYRRRGAPLSMRLVFLEINRYPDPRDPGHAYPEGDEDKRKASKQFRRGGGIRRARAGETGWGAGSSRGEATGREQAERLENDTSTRRHAPASSSEVELWQKRRASAVAAAKDRVRKRRTARLGAGRILTTGRRRRGFEAQVVGGRREGWYTGRRDEKHGKGGRGEERGQRGKVEVGGGMTGEGWVWAEAGARWRVAHSTGSWRGEGGTARGNRGQQKVGAASGVKMRSTRAKMWILGLGLARKRQKRGGVKEPGEGAPRRWKWQELRENEVRAGRGEGKGGCMGLLAEGQGEEGDGGRRYDEECGEAEARDVKSTTGATEQREDGGTGLQERGGCGGRGLAHRFRSWRPVWCC